MALLMARRTSFDANPLLSRKRTADLLKQLREVARELRMLRARVADFQKQDVVDPAPARAGRRGEERRRSG
jgi:hypothetical protein